MTAAEKVAALARGGKRTPPAGPPADVPPAGAWEPPTALPDLRPVPTFPIGLFPAVVAEFWRTVAETSGGPVDLPGTVGLAVLGAAVGRAVTAVHSDGWCRGPLFWSVVVAPSGSAKSAAVNAVTKPLADWDARKAAEYAEAAAAFVTAKAAYDDAFKAWTKDPDGDPPAEPAEPVEPITLVTGATIETLAGVLRGNPKGVGWIHDEVSALLRGLGEFKAGGGSDRPNLLLMWDGEGVFGSLRGGAGKLVKATAPHKFVAVSGCTTPADIAQFAAGTVGRGEAQHDGFAERFLVSMPDFPPARPATAAANARGARSAYAEFVFRLLALPVRRVIEPPVPPATRPWVRYEPHPVEFAPAAWARFQDLEQVHRCDRLNALDPSDPFRGWVSKLGANALAACGLFFALEHAAGPDGAAAGPPPGRIEVRHVEAAWALMEYFHGHALRVWGSGAGDTTGRRAAAVLQAARDIGDAKVTRRALHRRLRGRSWAKSPADLDAGLELLMDYGHFKPWLDEVPRRGRPSESYLVNPLPAVGGDPDVANIPPAEPLENKAIPPAAGPVPNIRHFGQTGMANIPPQKAPENKAFSPAEGPKPNFGHFGHASPGEPADGPVASAAPAAPAAPPGRPKTRFGPAARLPQEDAR